MRIQPVTNHYKKSAAAGYNRDGATAMGRGAFREATFYLLSAIVCDPDCWPAFFNLGNCWVKLEDYEAAVWAYEQAVKNCEDYAPLYLNLGVAHCKAGQVKEALPYLEQAWRLDPEGPRCAAALGYVCYRLGELGLSWHWYAKACRLEPGKEEYRDNLQYISEQIALTGR